MPSPVRIRWICVVAIILVVLLLGTASTQAQQTIHVPADQPTIQGAINAANAGDTVLVAPGTYVENINFAGKAITVTSSSGPSVTTIDGGAHGSVVTFSTGETANSVLSGFTIRNGFQSGSFGSGITIGSASPTITGNVITGNHAAGGCGINVNGGSPLIQNNTITANDQAGAGTSGQGGGGILVSGSSSAPGAPQIIGNTITNNSVAGGGDGGGISVGYFSSPLIQGNLIQGNKAYNFGGGVALESYNSPLLVQNVIVNNISLGGGSGAGVYVSPASDSTQTMVISNTIVANSAFDNTSGVDVGGFGQHVTFTNNIIVAASGQNAVTCSSPYSSISPVLSYNDAFAVSGAAWVGICDTTTNPGNLSADPLFLSAVNGDFHVQLGSPAIDAGDSSASNLPVTDFDGNPRIAANIDLGAYEVVNTSAANISPSSLSFTPQAAGTSSSPQTATLSSTGTTPFQITSVQITGAFSVTPTCPTLGNPGGFSGISAGSTCTYDVIFTPPSGSSPGTLTGALTVNGTNGTSLVVSLSGTVPTPPPTISLSTTSLSFASQTVGTTSGPQSVTLSNTSNFNLAITSIIASQQFTESDNCGSSLAGGASCTINVSFAPTAGGAVSGTLTLTNNAANSPQSVALSGTGVTPAAVSLSPSSLAFVGQQVGTTSAPQTITLTNTGGMNLNITVISYTNPFVLLSQTCLGTVAPGASCQMTVAFKPTDGGAVSGYVQVTDDASGSPQRVTLSGTGIAPPPVASLSPSSLTFPATLVGTTSAPQTITLTNTGGSSMNITSISYSNPFSLPSTNCLGTLGAGASCQMSVAFTPTANGPVSGLLQVTDTAGGSPQSVSLGGTGITPAVVSLSTSSLNFGSQLVATTSVPLLVTLTNTGGTSLNISSISTSASFAQTNNCPATLAGGANCTISVTFKPQASGAVNGALTITDSASGSPHTVSLSGTGVDFSITAGPSSVSVSAGSSANYTVTAKALGGNMGQSISLSCSSLPAHSTCSFSPTALTPGSGSASASLWVQTSRNSGSRTPSGTYTITISGTSRDRVHGTRVTLIVR